MTGPLPSFTSAFTTGGGSTFNNPISYTEQSTTAEQTISVNLNPVSIEESGFTYLTFSIKIANTYTFDAAGTPSVTLYDRGAFYNYVNFNGFCQRKWLGYYMDGKPWLKGWNLINIKIGETM